MTILGWALTDESRRFIRGFPTRGSWLLRLPNLEFSRLAELLPLSWTLVYQDERVEPLDFNRPADLYLVHAELDHESEARAVVAELTSAGRRCLLFGPLPSAWADHPPSWTGPRVVGDILNAWPEIAADISSGRLKELYRAPPVPAHFPCRHGLGPQVVMNTAEQRTCFIRGCACPEAAWPFCSERLYFGDRRLVRPPEEAIGEVLSLPRKHVRLLDEDVASDPDYYAALFRHLWNYHKHWTVNSSDRLFGHPGLIRLLAKAGTKVVILNESFLAGRVDAVARDRQTLRRLYRRVKYLQARRMLVGARILVRVDSSPAPDYRAIATAIRRIDIDFVEPRFIAGSADGTLKTVPAPYRPMVDVSEPAWVKNDFYSMGAILNRLARRPRRVGFYTTSRYMMPYSFAYRQDYLEAIC